MLWSWNGFCLFFPARFSYYFYLFTNKEKPGIATTFVTKGHCFNLGAAQNIWSGREDEDKMMVKWLSLLKEQQQLSPLFVQFIYMYQLFWTTGKIESKTKVKQITQKSSHAVFSFPSKAFEFSAKHKNVTHKKLNFKYNSKCIS